MSRDGTLVIRPDSGEPAVVILRVLNILGNKFGYTVNEKGYKVLDSHVRIIQGDGVNIDSIEMILSQMKGYGWSADNIAFGSGGALLQKMDRDTQKFAFKCSSINIDGVEKEVYKEPVTDAGKRSKAGRLMLVKTAEGYLTYNWGNNVDELVTVFENGELKVDYSLDEIRKRAIM
jgi:nicotinamide phosphoribosyltransferase